MSQRIMGVVLIGFEGPLDAAWHDDILRRRRRPKHALMPQLLAQVLASTVPLTLAQARIVRIAVRPALQRRGIGSMLLSEIADQLSGRVALLGASFGEDADTVSFWRANGYTPIHRGYRRNARSGLKSVLMARALSHRAAQLIACAGHLLTDNQRALEARSGKVRFAELPADDELLRRFARGERSLVDSAGALRRFIDTDNRSTSTSTATGANNMADDEPDWLVDLFDRLAPGVRGRQARERALRRWLRAALAD